MFCQCFSLTNFISYSATDILASDWLRANLSVKNTDKTLDEMPPLDNAPAHKSVVAMADVRDCGFELVDHPPYSPDFGTVYLAIFCSPTRKKHLAGKQYRSDDEVISAVEDLSRIRMRASIPSRTQHCN